MYPRAAPAGSQTPHGHLAAQLQLSAGLHVGLPARGAAPASWRWWRTGTRCWRTINAVSAAGCGKRHPSTIARRIGPDGHMVADARAAVDALSKDNAVDAKRIYLFGYGMGGNVALYTGALEPRVAGVVSVCGFTPMRTDTTETGTGGVARYSVDGRCCRGWGCLSGNESKIPYDYDEMLGAIRRGRSTWPIPCSTGTRISRMCMPRSESARKVYGLYQGG